MAFTFTNSKGKTYILHGNTRVLKSGKESTLYYFAKEEKPGQYSTQKVSAQQR